MADAIPLKIEAGQLGRFLSTDTVPTGNLGTGSASGTTYLRGDKTWATPAGGAGSNVGTAVLDFGAFPGKSDTSIAVTGQAGIVAGSIVEAWIRPVATAEHSADEHIIEALKIVAGNILAATGFTIYGVTQDKTRRYGNWTVAWMWS